MRDFFVWCEAERDRLVARLAGPCLNESRIALAQRILELDILLFEANIILMPSGWKAENCPADVIANPAKVMGIATEQEWEECNMPE